MSSGGNDEPLWRAINQNISELRIPKLKYDNYARIKECSLSKAEQMFYNIWRLRDHKRIT